MRVNHIQHLLPSDLNPIYLCKRAPPYLKRKNSITNSLLCKGTTFHSNKFKLFSQKAKQKFHLSIRLITQEKEITAQENATNNTLPIK